MDSEPIFKLYLGMECFRRELRYNPVLIVPQCPASTFNLPIYGGIYGASPLLSSVQVDGKDSR